MRDDEPAIEELRSKTARITGVPCAACGRRLCGHEALFSIALGIADQPRCLVCLARSLDRSPHALRDHLRQHFSHRDCYGTVWDEQTAREGANQDGRPVCLWPAGELPSSGGDDTVTPAADAPATAELSSAAVIWDAGDLDCGDLILELRRRIRELPPGDVLEVIARQTSAAEDLPAWCRLTGHRLLTMTPPRYRIERKRNSH